MVRLVPLCSLFQALQLHYNLKLMAISCLPPAIIILTLFVQRQKKRSWKTEMSSFMPNLYYYDHKMEGYPKSDGNFIYGPLLEKKILKFLQIAKLLSNNTKNADRKPLHRFMEELKGMQIVLRSKRCWYYEDSSKCQKSKLKNSLLPLHRGQEALLDIWYISY